MIIKPVISLSLLFLSTLLSGQKVSAVYKTEDLLKRLNNKDTTYVVNFWATWCKPCVQELPAFDSLAAANKNVKVLLVCLDFKEELDKKVNPFLLKRKIKSECVLLDEVNGNEYINKISESWSGAIPATVFVKGKTKILKEKKLNLAELKVGLRELNQN